MVRSTPAPLASAPHTATWTPRRRGPGRGAGTGAGHGLTIHPQELAMDHLPAPAGCRDPRTARKGSRGKQMRILLVASAYNSLTQRVHAELAGRQPQVAVERAVGAE